MSFRVQTKENIVFLTSDCLELPGVVHGFSTRLGGVSSGVHSSMNLGVHRGDIPENVLENHRLLADAIGYRAEDTVFARQRHTDCIRRVGQADRGSGLFRDDFVICDSHITNEPGVAVMVFSADCTPILLLDPVHRAIGAVHSGWRGTALGIAAKAVQRMEQEFGSDPADIRAAIGPCIGPCHFETDRDVPDAMLRALGQEAASAIRQQGEKYHVDLKVLNRIWLKRAGVQTVDVCDICTACEPERFWSHRTMGDGRGVQCAVICLQE